MALKPRIKDPIDQCILQKPRKFVATNKSTFTVIHISHHSSQIYLVPDDSGIRGVFNTKLYVIKSGFIWFYLATRKLEPQD
jgi:hypothetical protein